MIKPKDEIILSQEQIEHLTFLSKKKDYLNLEKACRNLLFNFPHNAKINH